MKGKVILCFTILSMVFGALLSVIAIIVPPLEAASSKLDKVLSNNSSVGTIPIIGTPSSIKAIGPCFNSPAA